MGTVEMEPLWTAEEVAKVLRCDARTVRRKTRKEGLPFTRTASNRMMFNPLRVKQWLAERETVLNPETAATLTASAAKATFGSWDGRKRAKR